MEKSTEKFLIRCGIIWLISAFIYFFQIYLRNAGVLHSRMKFPTMFNFGLFLAVPLMIFFHSRKKISEFSPKKFRTKPMNALVFWFEAVVCLLIFGFILYFGNVNVIHNNALFFGIILEVLYVFSFIFIFLALFGMEFFKEFYRESILVFFILFDFMLITMFLGANWHIFSETLVRMVYWLMSLFSSQTNMFFISGTPHLTLKTFSVSVGASCSGIESLSMFLFVAIFVFLLDWGKINMKRAWLLIPGLAGMFFMSVVRMSVLMWVGTFNPALSLGLFHTNMGWILLVIYLLVFWYFYYPYLTGSKTAKNRNPESSKT